MTDREKVIKAFEDYEPYAHDFPVVTIRSGVYLSALAVLKEQELELVKTDMYGNAYCPRCSTEKTIEMGAQKLHLGTQFCPNCGRKVKWDD